MLALLLLSVDDPKTADTLTILYRKYSKLMYSEAYKVLEDKQDAEDAVADAFECLLKVRQLPDPDSRNAKGLLVIISRRRALDIARKKNRRPAMSLDAAQETGAFSHPDAAADGPDMDEVLAIAEAIAKIPEDLRSVLIKNLIEGYTTAEIAEMEGIKQNSVQKRIRKAKEKIRELLGEDPRS